MRMQSFFESLSGFAIAATLTLLLAPAVGGQTPPVQAPQVQAPQVQPSPIKDARSREAKGLSARATPADYQAHAQAGAITIAADFAGHGVPTPDSVFSTEEYVVVEVALYGPAGTRLNVSYKDFSLRLNGKKTPLPAQPYEVAFRSLKDPEWVPPVPAESKSKTGINGGGQGDAAPAPVHMSIALELAMEQKVKNASIPEGDRALPGAGLIFFQHGGKISGIRSIELLYNGAAGKATLSLPE